MGFFLIIVMAIVVIIAIVLDVVLIGAALAITAAAARRRPSAWPVAGIVCTIATLLTIAGVALWPYAPVRPGSDYDIAAYNLAVQGFGYAISLGVGAAVAAIAALCCPRQTDSLHTAQPTIAPAN